MNNGEGMSPSVFLVGYGNPGRRDDGLGPWIAGELEQRHRDRVTVQTVFQLGIEHCVEMARHKVVFFVDAARIGPEPFRVRRLAVSPSIGAGFTTHLVRPEVLLALCEYCFAARPLAWLIGVRGRTFGGGEGLSRRALRNARAAIAFLDALLERGSEAFMAETQAQTKTILVIDDDPDVRATLRVILESAGFAVGEAADGIAGLKIAEKIRPDAIILDLMMETVDAGSRVSTTLKSSGFTGPIYLLSAAGDSVRYNIDTQQLGLAGIFQKPADPKTLVATLKTSLKVP
ncbi:MAG TPA: hydrogenase maturation protease [Spirochaetia bacterium]|nr:hydrogenase maturation protease [Spirochaetia bacterium]